MSAFAKLTTKHQLAVSHYRANGRNQTAAWIAAGYVARSAKACAARFFARPDVQAALAESDGAVLGKLKADADEVLERLTHIMRGNMADFVTIGRRGKASLDLAKVSRAQWAAVSQLKLAPDGSVTLKLYDARAAAVDLGKHLGLFNGFEPINPDPGSSIEELVTKLPELGRHVAFLLARAVQPARQESKPLH